MAGKNTAVFGIYATYAGVETVSIALRRMASATPTSLFYSRKTLDLRTSRTKKARRLPKEQRQEALREVLSEAPSDGCWVSER